jgi:UPF0176 protein
MSNETAWYVTTFYRFLSLENPQLIADEWTQKAESLEVNGLLILGKEGFNTTCCSRSKENLAELKSWVLSRFDCADMMFKDAVSTVEPFPKFKAKVRDEIVTAGAPDLVPDNKNHRHLSPEEWDRVLKEEKDVVVLDTRNWYEVRIGTFKNAVDPQIEQFTEFPKFVEEKGYDKDQKMLIFCTGGIRCEKGILELERRGFKNVYQLEGGILNYLEKFPNQEFQGECFVFDNRVAVDQNLQPTRQYKLCPHCGQPAEVKISCARCETEAMICVSCVQKEGVREVCSKNCAHHYSMNPKKKGRRQIPTWEIAKKPRFTSTSSRR